MRIPCSSRFSFVVLRIPLLFICVVCVIVRIPLQIIIEQGVLSFYLILILVTVITYHIFYFYETSKLDSGKFVAKHAAVEARENGVDVLVRF